MPPTRPVGAILRELRASHGASLRSAAKEMGVDPSYLSKVERGQKPLPDELRARAAAYYDTDANRLAIAEGELPSDILRILAEHPEALDELRQRYAAS